MYVCAESLSLSLSLFLCVGACVCEPSCVGMYVLSTSVGRCVCVSHPQHYSVAHMILLRANPSSTRVATRFMHVSV